MIRIDTDITLRLQGPLITKSTAPGAYGLDEVMARNAAGIPYVAGTHIAGKLRQAWEELAEALNGKPETLPVPDKTKREQLLGKTGYHGDYGRGGTKQLLFGDFLLYSRHSQPGIRYRINIDEKRLAAKEGAQLMVETPFASGEALALIGTLTFLAPDRAEGEKICKMVVRGLQWVPQLGAFRSIGFGRMTGVEMGEIRETRPRVRPRTWAGPDGFGLQIFPEGPFCISRRPVDKNVFVSGTEIPGNVIIGCIAHALDANKTESHFQTLYKNLSKIRITHAFPSSHCLKRPVKPPLSLVKAAGTLYDTALLDGPCLIHDQAPAFSVDWKNSADVDDSYGWPTVDREMRVRTKIDRENLRSAENQLFAYDMAAPGKTVWLARADVGRVEKDLRQQVLEELAALLEIGLMGFGKTKAVARINLVDQENLVDAKPCGPPLPGLGVDGLLVVTLQTPALLCSPEGLNEKSGADELKEAYTRAWSELSPDITLVRYFARQSLAGGKYLHRRFNATKKDHPYYPWLLTTAGSVFVFSVQDHVAATECVDRWLNTGLPLPGPVKTFYQLEDADKNQWWRYCPYIPQNGFGEIVVNLEDHQRLCPQGAVPPVSVIPS